MGSHRPRLTLLLVVLLAAESLAAGLPLAS